MQGQSVSAETLRIGCLANFQDARNVALEARPAELRLAVVVLQVTGTAVAAKDTRKYFTEQLNEHFSSAREGDLVKDEVRRHHGPEPALFTVGPVSGLVAVDDRFVGQLPFQFRAGFGHCHAGLFPTVLNAAQTERCSQNLFQ